MIAPRAIALAGATAEDRPLLSVEPAGVQLSILKRAEVGGALVLRLCGPWAGTVTARIRLFRPLRHACLSDLDERVGAPLEVEEGGDSLSVPIAAGQVVTLRIE
jgi:hypothetical protein